MKIGKIIKTESSNSETEFIEINTTKVFAGLTFAGLVGGLVTLFTFMLITYPQNKNQIEYENDIANFQYINFVLRNKNDTIRKQSFELLLKAGIIEDTEERLLNEYIEKNNLPNWYDYKEFVPLKASTDNQISGAVNNNPNSSSKTSNTNNNGNSSDNPE